MICSGLDEDEDDLAGTVGFPVGGAGAGGLAAATGALLVVVLSVLALPRLFLSIWNSSLVS